MKRRDVIFAAIAIVGIWQIAAMIVHMSILPTPLEVLVVLIKELQNGLLLHFMSSLWRVMAGMLLSVLVAAPAGLVIGSSRRINRLFSPII
ncbi:MAG TPA: ABC transporter permease, partial [Anaerolineales bacterium]|nr:ABC transporter permease [Anaerolineales bacterium]